MPVAIERALFIALVAILPLEHTPGLRVLLGVTLGVFGFFRIFVTRDFTLLSRFWGGGLWVVWASASYFWSVAPERTFADLKHDLWLPVLALTGTYYIFRRLGRPTLLLWAILTGTVTNSLVVFLGYPKAPFHVPVVQYYFSTIAYASTYALSFLAVALPWVFDKRFPRVRTIAVAVVALNIGVGLILESRAFILVVTLLLVLFAVVLVYRSRHGTAYVVVAATLIAGSAFTLINRDRIAQVIGETDVAGSLEHIVSSEVRYVIWRSWYAKALDGPFLGVGYGRDIPGKTLSEAERARLSSIDPFATMHAHNVFLAVVLETGWPGVTIFLLMLGQISLRFARAVGRKHRYVSLAGWSGLSFLAATILKNQTDYILVFGVAVLTFTLIGALLAWSQNPRSSS